MAQNFAAKYCDIVEARFHTQLLPSLPPPVRKMHRYDPTQFKPLPSDNFMFWNYTILVCVFALIGVSVAQ